METTEDGLEATLQERFGHAIADLSRMFERKAVLAYHAKARRRRAPLIAALISVVLIAAVPAYAAGRATAAPPLTPPQAVAATGPAPVVVQNAVAAALTLDHGSYVIIVNRVAVKLVTVGDFLKTWSSDNPPRCGTGSLEYYPPAVWHEYIYVVALSGDFRTPSVAPAPSPSSTSESTVGSHSVGVTTTHWAVVFVPMNQVESEGSRSFEIAGAGQTGDWPPCFNELTNVSR